MIPILYDSTETAFTSQGLGCLTDAISCEVTEERNGEFELELEYPISGIHYGDIAYSRYIAAIPADGEDAQPFEIYKITRPLAGVVTVYARHLSYRLGYTPVRPTTAATSAASALSTLKSAAVVPCPFTFASDVTKAGTFTNSKLQSLRSLLGGQTGSILDVFGGEYKFDKWNVSLLAARGSSIPVTIEYGKNLTDLKQEENIESTYTAVICTWQKESDGVTTTQTGDIVYTENKDAFPYARTLVVDKSTDYDTQPTVAQLTADATSYIKANNVGVPNVSIDVSFVNLRDTEEYRNVAPLQRIHLCDTIKVKFSKLGVNASAKITKTVYDSLSERYKSLTIGDARGSLAGTVVGISEEIDSKADEISSALKNDIDRATQLITGNKGGYVVIRNNETTGYPEEILVMDQPDIDTAENVWRFNKSGLGHANSYNGDMDLALTMDGEIVASMIKSGTLSAILITATDMVNGRKNYWNLSTGAFAIGDADNFILSDGSTAEIQICNGTIIGSSIVAGSIRSKTGAVTMNLDNSTIEVTATGSIRYTKPDGSYAMMTADSLGFYKSDASTESYFGRAYMMLDGCYMRSERDNTDQNFIIDGSLFVNELYYYKSTDRNSSDRRLKRNIKRLNNSDSAKFILSLKPSKFQYKEGSNPNPEEWHHGLIAQEVQEAEYDEFSVVESKVRKDIDGKEYLALHYEKLITDMIATIQYQNNRIDDLESRLTSMEKRISELTSL